jgi:hypothetical protein
VTSVLRRDPHARRLRARVRRTLEGDAGERGKGRIAWEEIVENLTAAIREEMPAEAATRTPV